MATKDLPQAGQVSDEGHTTSVRHTVIDSIIAQSEPEMADMRSLGSQGLNQSGGYIYEESLHELQGQAAARIYKQMRLNDPACGTMLWFTKALVRNVNWYVQPASSEQDDVDNAEFIDSCINDMDQPFASYVDEHMSMMDYGFAPAEILFKRRLGQAPEAWLRSKFTDGRIGLRGMPLRAQDTIVRWEFDEDGGTLAMYQQAPPKNKLVRIPIDKIALFRTTNIKGSPEGESVLRRCYKPYVFKSRLQNYEAIGIERDLAGYPVFRMPKRLMVESASPEQKKDYAKWQRQITRIRRGQQEGSIIPSEFDANGNQLYELKLLSAGGAKQHNVSEVINRYDDEIWRCLLADFMKLGSGSNSSGSWAMHSDKTQMYLQAVSVFLSQIAQVYNKTVIPKLMRMNGFAATDYPTLEHTPLEKVDQKYLADTLLALAQSGMPLWPNEKLMERVYDILGVPSDVDAERQARIRETMPVVTSDPTQALVEVEHDAPADFSPDKTELGADKDKPADETNKPYRTVKA